MVQSVLVPGVSYPEDRTLDKEDLGTDTAVFEIEVLGVSAEIAVGQGKYAFIDQNLVFYPVYLIADDKVDVQIGVFELFSDAQPNLLDEDGDIDVSKLGSPLLYSFVSKEIVEDARSGPEATTEDPAPEDSAKHQPADDKSEETAEIDVSRIAEETTTDESIIATREKEAYKKGKKEPWIQTFMRNNNFDIVENEGGGDCLFASIRDGLSRVGVTTTVEEMRSIVSDAATEATFDQYTALFTAISGEKDRIISEITRVAADHKEMVRRAKKATDRSDKLELATKAKELADMHKVLKVEKQDADNMLEEFDFMEGVSNLDQMKAKMQTKDYWGDTFAITALERGMKIKLILFSEEAYRQKDLANVLQCGQDNDDMKEDPEPEYYLMLNYLGYHYQLITYKGRGAFFFKGIPFDVKKLIMSRCLERLAGPFYMIGEFRDFMEAQQVPMPDPVVEVETLSDLYDDGTVFQFYDRSGDAKPGRGSGETIKPGDQPLFARLGAEKGWRKILSNSWAAPFMLDGHKWQSVEHYYQASKFKDGNPQFYESFTLDVNPGSALATDPAVAEAAGGKTGKYKKTDVRPKDVSIDPNFFDGKHKDALEKALHAKFTQNDDLKQVLLATKNAKLQRYKRGAPASVAEDLMRVRRMIEAEKS